MAATENLSATQLAAVLGISRQRVCELARKGKIRREADGKFNLPRVHTALQQNLDARQSRPSIGRIKSQSLQTGASEDPAVAVETMADAQRRHEILKAEKLELELRKRQGELIEKSMVKEKWFRISAIIRNRLLLLPGNLAAKVATASDPREAEKILGDEVHDILQSLSETNADAA